MSLRFGTPRVGGFSWGFGIKMPGLNALVALGAVFFLVTYWRVLLAVYVIVVVVVVMVAVGKALSGGRAVGKRHAYAPPIDQRKYFAEQAAAAAEREVRDSRAAKVGRHVRIEPPVTITPDGVIVDATTERDVYVPHTDMFNHHNGTLLCGRCEKPSENWRHTFSMQPGPLDPPSVAQTVVPEIEPHPYVPHLDSWMRDSYGVQVCGVCMRRKQNPMHGETGPVGAATERHTYVPHTDPCMRDAHGVQVCGTCVRRRQNPMHDDAGQVEA